MKISATFKWNDRTKIDLQQAPEKILRGIARQTLDYTGSNKVVANSTGASYKMEKGHSTGATERSMYTEGVKGDFKSGFYIGNFTDYASHVYNKSGVHWTNPNTKTKWFDYIWNKYSSMIIDTQVSRYKL